jgi:hypothetical protein
VVVGAGCVISAVVIKILDKIFQAKVFLLSILSHLVFLAEIFKKVMILVLP